MAVATTMGDDNGRRLTADRRVLSAFWLDLAATTTMVKAETGATVAATTRPETLAEFRPDPVSPISP